MIKIFDTMFKTLNLMSVPVERDRKNTSEQTALHSVDYD